MKALCTREPTCCPEVTELHVLLIYCHLFCAEWSEIMARTQSPHQQPLHIQRVRIHGSQYFQCQKVVNRALLEFLSGTILSTAFRNHTPSIFSQSKRTGNVSLKAYLQLSCGKWTKRMVFSVENLSISRKVVSLHLDSTLSSSVTTSTKYHCFSYYR